MTRLLEAIAAWRLGTKLFVAQAIVLFAIVASAGHTPRHPAAHRPLIDFTHRTCVASRLSTAPIATVCSMQT